MRYGARTVEGYLQHVRVLLTWLTDRHLELVNVRSDDLLAYQAALLSARKQDGTPYSIDHQRGRIAATKSLFGFLYRRGYLLSDPAAPLELPAIVGELRTLLAGALVHPEHARLCIVIALDRDDSARGPHLIDRVYREVLAPGGARPGAPTVCCVGGPRCDSTDWEAILATMQGHLILPAEDAEAALRARSLPAIRLELLLNRQPLNLQPLTGA